MVLTPDIPNLPYDLDPMSHDFNFFTIDSRCFFYVTPLMMKARENVRIRFGNIVHDAHPMHIHGHQFAISAVTAIPYLFKTGLLRKGVAVSYSQAQMA